ncbi:hypothetical protein SKAU_G00128930 [Synaphobranchus kaupii]|uniref:Uncharacterized protein n=1 Tax=Synaphobranchus kaupii TaxID=118154 RepID=A0A9Q1FQZ9_SYNKA|nr:hypothetical protein SKAU_G00128930 [Synaphobranchus kaupii]
MIRLLAVRRIRTLQPGPVEWYHVTVGQRAGITGVFDVTAGMASPSQWRLFAVGESEERPAISGSAKNTSLAIQLRGLEEFWVRQLDMELNFLRLE